MNQSQILAICGYVIGVGSLTTPDVIAGIIEAFGAPHSATLAAVRIIGGLVLLATLIQRAATIKSTPTGTHQVFSTDDAPSSATLVTAATAPKGPPA